MHLSSSRLVIKGYRRDLVHEDLWTLNKRDMSKHVSMLFEREWQQEMLKYQR